MRRRLPTAATLPRTRQEAAALDQRERIHGTSPEIVTVERQGNRLTFSPTSLAAQLGVRPEFVRLRRDAAGRVFVRVFRPMADSRFGVWEEFATELLG